MRGEPGLRGTGDVLGPYVAAVVLDEACDLAGRRRRQTRYDAPLRLQKARAASRRASPGLLGESPDEAHEGGGMIAKPAVLECTRCGKIFIGWKTDAAPKRGPTCLRCQARQAWNLLTSAAPPKKRGAGGKRTRPRKPATRSVAREKPPKRRGASAQARRARKR